MYYSSDFLKYLADFICGDDSQKYPIYRSGSYLTRFFQNININVIHDGSTRKYWVQGVLAQLSEEDIELVIITLVSPKLYMLDDDSFRKAWTTMNRLLEYENRKIIELDDKLVITEHKMKIEEKLAYTLQMPTNSNYNAYTKIEEGRDIANNISSNKEREILELLDQIIEMSRAILDNQKIIESVEKMKDNVDASTFKDYYKDFISLVSDHMTIFLPIINTLRMHL